MLLDAKRLCRVIRHPALGLLAVLSLLNAAEITCAAAPIRTEDGLVEGVQENGTLVFKGIPFAAPPIGDLRWQAPQPPIAWTGVRKADRFSPVSLQDGTYPPDAPAEPTSEDCLYLNVWTPVDAPTTKLPVMVWIYGGGLENGSASMPLYAGDKLVQHGVILVTANYRLGVFGYLAHPELTRESPFQSSGNYGLLDQIAALRWVQRNIAAFGGDPARVTVFGQSSGAISISALVASPLAKGLFQRAIGQSGGLFEPLDLFPNFKLEEAEQAGQDFVKRAGAKDLRELRLKPAVELMKTPFDTHLIVDGHALTQAPYDAYRKGEENPVALLVGSNADEGRTFLANRTITVANYTQQLGQDVPAFLVRLTAPKPGTTDEQARTAAAAFEGDIRFRWDMWTWARLGAQAGKAKVFSYEFTQVPPYRAGDKHFGWGASHGTEMPYVFDHLDQTPLAWTSEDRALASTMASYWTNFAKTGDPNGAGLPTWPQFAGSDQQFMQLGAEIKPAMLRDEAALRRINRIYATARFAAQNFYVLIFAAVLVATLLVGAVVTRWRRSLRKPADSQAAI